MASINIDNIKSSMDTMMNNNIVANMKQVEESYINSTTYQTSKLNSNIEISNTSEEIRNELSKISKNIEKFSTKLNHYINDYYSLNQYLTNGDYYEINSNLVKTNIKNIIPIQNNEIESIKVINIRVSIDEEENKET